MSSRFKIIGEADLVEQGLIKDIHKVLESYGIEESFIAVNINDKLISVLGYKNENHVVNVLRELKRYLKFFTKEV